MAYLGHLVALWHLTMTTYIFNLVDTHIGGWKLNVNNMTGLLMGSLDAMCLALNLFTLTFNLPSMFGTYVPWPPSMFFVIILSIYQTTRKPTRHCSQRKTMG